MRKFVLALALVALLVLPAGRVAAWNNHGHMVVAKIAYDRLDDGLKMKVASILKKHPHYDLFLLKGKPEGVAETEWVFLKAATWPDWVRPDRFHRKSKEITKYHKGEWHFLDLPFVNPDERDKFSEDSLQPKGETVLDGLKWAGDKLASEDATPEDRAVAVCWLLHLIGDMHQPLHCASYYSSHFPKGDRGGNNQTVKAHGRPVKLHAYWDALLGTSVKYRVIAADADRLSHDPRSTATALKKLLEKKDYLDWVKDSHALARSDAYEGGELKSQPLTSSHDDGQLAIPELPPNYTERARETARQQAALAGYRLATRLASLK